VTIARTAATGTVPMLPELLQWSSSFDDDLHFWREDILGSVAHVLMLAQTKIVAMDKAKAIARELLVIHDAIAAGTLQLSRGEEDVHMAVERCLTERLGEVAGHLHTARSRNDQVALDLRMYAREAGRKLALSVLSLVSTLLARAEQDRHILLPAYTHRQRAQPVSAAMYFGAWSAGLLRACASVLAAVEQANVLPLGACAVSGSSLPIDRTLTQAMLGFSRVSVNALDTVGDRDFALDLAWAGTRVTLALSRLAQDLVDFSTNEFGFVKLGDAVSAGSSMMPQKKNPDAFELVRGKSGAAVGRLVHLLTLVKALPTGYNRDLQEDRQALFGAATEPRAAVEIVQHVLPHVTFDAERCASGLASGFTQSTDLAEALVVRGVPFREAYRASGALVRFALDRKMALSDVDTKDAKKIHPALDAEALKALDAARAAAAKESIGGTGARAIDNQLADLASERERRHETAGAIVSLEAVAERLREKVMTT
jgi:argininosuccinate lyase